MKIYVNARQNTSIIKANQWIRLIKDESFNDLSRYIEKIETYDGDECYIFVEIDLPLPRNVENLYKRHGQLDMLICFSQRLLLCEIKASPLYASLRQRLDNIREQIDWQEEWLSRLLLESPFGATKVRPVLFVPQLRKPDFEEIIRDLNAPHILFAVADPTSKGQQKVLGKNYHFYFPETLYHQIKRTEKTSKQNLHKHIRNILSPTQESLLEFNSFVELKDYLQNIPQRPGFIPPQWYVAELRLEKLEEAVEILNNKRVLVVQAPPGMGKDIFVKELIQAILTQYPILEDQKISLGHCHSLSDICTEIYQRMPNNESLSDYEAQIQALAKNPTILWVKTYNEKCSLDLGQAVQIYRNFWTQVPEQTYAYWII